MASTYRRAVAVEMKEAEKTRRRKSALRWGCIEDAALERVEGGG
ncbi:MAG: hypothetical protein OJF58_004067 [Enhydrobacter sp.]|jgi:hypothetical protein|nr:MAG: hypothetical protein OJF58_004067 [Enhydrobacter sp.]